MKKLSVLLFMFLALFGLAGFACLPVGRVFASTEIGTIDDAYKYAWGDRCGWLNFDTQQGAVTITDTNLTGYVWSENFGWINLSPPGSGVSNNNEGTLSGYAWGENTGWINFSGVIINSSGQFTGTASGDITGTISFGCSGCTVKTDWRPKSSRAGGGLPPGAYSAPSAPVSGFSVLINDGAAYTNNSVVILKLQAGSDTKRMAISESPSFENAIQENYQTLKTFVLSQGDGKKTIYVKFYTQYGQSSEPVSDSIILKTQPPEIKITYIKDKYSSDEDVIVSGKSEANAEISFYLDQNYGSFQADNKGDWLITLGKLALGSHKLELTAHDFAGNNSKPLAADFSVIKAAARGPELGTAFGPILRQLEKGISLLIPKFFKPKEKEPEPVVMVPKEVPMCMKGKFAILPVEPIRRFVFAPLPREIKVLTMKFPELGKTFSEVGIKKLTDIEKLKGANLTLPSLSEVAGVLSPELKVGKFAIPRGIPFAKLTVQEKQKIPAEIVFAKTGGELVDLSVVLSINEKSEVQQTIEGITGKPLRLIVKPEKSVKSVKGYIIFKKKTPAPVSFEFPLNYLTASLVFVDPSFSKPQEKPVNVEEKLVLLEFEYKDQGDGIYVADVVSPVIDGEYEIITVMDYEDPSLGSKAIKMIYVVDPEGYVYEKSGDKETRIGGAIVSIYWLNPETKQYELWPSRDFQQENPQTTDVRGTYSFLVPDGYYYLTINAPGYISYDGKPFQVTGSSGIHFNIELKTRYWWVKVFDWKNILLIAVFVLLLFNFYRDRIRLKRIQNTQF